MPRPGITAKVEMHLRLLVGDTVENGSSQTNRSAADALLGNPLLPPHYDSGSTWYDGSEGVRRQYWQALLLLSVGLSLLLGAFVFLGLTMRRCPALAAGSAAASLSSVALVALLVSAKAGDDPKYE